MSPHPPQSSANPSGHGAQVRVVPPALFVLPFAAAAALNRYRPWRLPGGAFIRACGWALTGAGLTLAASGAETFRRRGTTVVPHRPVNVMVTDGPYRFTRNPMYTGMAVTYVGGSLILGTAWPLPALPLALVAVRRLAIEREEKYLSERFGAGYDEFRARVPRWLGRRQPASAA